MNPLWRASLIIISLFLLTACAPAPTPAPTPTATPTSTPTPVPQPVVVEDTVPYGVPVCKAGTAYEEPLKFDWPSIDQVGEADWYYYQCGQSPVDLAATYRSRMTNPPFNWYETAWVERPEGTLGVYFHSVYQVYLYIWFLSDKDSGSGSNLVIAERVGQPLELSCH